MVILFIETDASLDIVLGDMPAVIILNDLDFDVFRDGGNWPSEVKRGADENMVPAKGPVLQDETTVEVWNEEE